MNERSEPTSDNSTSVNPIVMRHFLDEQPKEGGFFCFACPIQKDRWEIGWRDWYHYRIEAGESYRHDDKRLTYWFPLPDVPAD